MKRFFSFNQNISSIVENNILIFIILSLIIWLIFSFIQIIFPKNEIVILFSPFIKKLYSNVCHQADHKLLIINGEKTFICARCIGIYFGSLISLLLLFILPKFKIKINLKIILFSFMILISDVILHTLHIYDYSKVLALFTGIFFSFILTRFTINSIKQNLAN
ncbi:MAG: hypothetical protein STSR0008_04000 [Ignavibacterium sp.]